MRRITEIEHSFPMKIVACSLSVSDEAAFVQLAAETGDQNFRKIAALVPGAELSLTAQETEAFIQAVFDTPLMREFERDLQCLFCDENGDWLSTSMETQAALRFLDGMARPGARQHEVDVAVKIRREVVKWAEETEISEVMFSGLLRKPNSPNVSILWRSAADEVQINQSGIADLVREKIQAGQPWLLDDGRFYVDCDLSFERPVFLVERYQPRGDSSITECCIGIASNGAGSSQGKQNSWQAGFLVSGRELGSFKDVSDAITALWVARTTVASSAKCSDLFNAGSTSFSDKR